MKIEFRNVTFRMFAVFMVLMCSIGMVCAQPHFGKMTVTGYILDSKTAEPLIAATVKATSADGGTGTFAITDENGKFSLDVSHPGKWTLTFNYVGYKEMVKEVNIMPHRTNIGKFNLKEDPHILKEIETIGHSERIKQRGDTLAYNADAYKVQDGANAEQLVAKMPGIEVTNDGVKAHGETVQKILVDGKEFFDNDLKLALKSLPAEVVESVQVYDKKSDQAEFTGVDDGETVKAMDLTTKSYRRNGVFGKAIAGWGNNFDFDNNYWNGSLNLNVFNGDRRITLQGMTNNVNQRNFSNDDMEAGMGMMMGRRWTPQGVAKTNGAGINYSDVYAGGKVDVQLSYFFNNGRTVSTDSTYTDDLTRDYSSFSSSNNIDRNTSHRIGGRISIKPGKNDEIMIRPSLNFQNRRGDGLSESRSWNHKLEDVWFDRDTTALWTGDLLSRSQSLSHSESDSWNVGANVLWRHRLAKPGRTLSINVNGNLSGSDSKSVSGKDVFMGQVRNIYGQVNDNDNNNKSLRGNIQWTEPLATGLNLSLRYDMSYNTSDRTTVIDYYKDMDCSVYNYVDSANTNKYIQKNLRNSGEVGLSYNKGTLKLNASARFQTSRLEGEQDYYLLHNTVTTDPKNYFSVLPNFRLEYRTKGGTMFRLNYRSNTSNPSVNQLQKSIDTTNPLRYSTGNDDLDQSTSHNIMAHMTWANTETAQNFMVFAGFNFTQDQISTQTLRNLSKTDALRLAAVDEKYGFKDKDRMLDRIVIPAGGSISRPINRSGSKSVFFDMIYGFPFDAIMSNVNVSLGGNASVTPSNTLTFDGKYNKDIPVIENLESETSSLGLNPRLHITSNISSDLNFNILYEPSFQWVKDNNSVVENMSYINQTLRGELNWTFWKGFTTDQSVAFVRYGGSAMDQPINECVWNASIGKKFLKGNAAEIKLQAYDILGSNKGYTRNVGTANISTSYRNFMPRYFMVTFTYNIRAYRSGGKQSTRTEDPGMGLGPGRGFGGPGGPGRF